VSICGQKTADGRVAKRVKSGLLTMNVAHFEIPLIIPLIQAQARRLPMKQAYTDIILFADILLDIRIEKNDFWKFGNFYLKFHDNSRVLTFLFDFLITQKTFFSALVSGIYETSLIVYRLNRSVKVV
jgi:hypothetical protein